MSVIITNVSDHDDLEGPNQYVLRINERIIANFDHVRSRGLGECLRAAAAAADKAACICPPADKGHAYGKITPGCPVHAVPVDAALFNLPGSPLPDGGGDE